MFGDVVIIDADVVSINGFPLPGIFDSISAPGELLETTQSVMSGEENTQITGFKPRTVTIGLKWVDYDDAMAGFAIINGFFMTTVAGKLPKYYLAHPYAFSLKMGLVLFHKFSPSGRSGDPIIRAQLVFKEAVSPLLLSSAVSGATGGATDTAADAANDTADKAAEAAAANDSDPAGLAKKLVGGATYYSALTGYVPTP